MKLVPEVLAAVRWINNYVLLCLHESYSQVIRILGGGLLACSDIPMTSASTRVLSIYIYISF